MSISNPVARVADFVNQIKENPRGKSHLLIPLLSEQHPVYQDRSTREAIRMRGYAMAALELTGTPERTLPYILECLESEFHPYLVAASARALRGLKHPHPQIAPFLIKAIYNIWESDNPVSFEDYRVEWPLKEFSTALTEILETLVYFGSFAKAVLPDLELLIQAHSNKFSNVVQIKLIETIDAINDDERIVDTGCCDVPSILKKGESSCELAKPSDIPGDLKIQDQDGVNLEWNQFFSQKPAVLAFFYTRCQNPRKCTQTVFNLAAIKKELEKVGLARQVRIAAITYDPKFDSPQALKSYGDARNFVFDDDTKMFRVPEGFEQVVRAFRLGVNFTGSQVNSHRIELFLLNGSGEIEHSFLRLQSEPQQVVETVNSLLPNSTTSRRSRASTKRKLVRGSRLQDWFQAASSFLLGLLMVFFPKCPMCWFSYMSLLGIAGAESIPYSPWLLPIIMAMLSVNLYLLFRGAPSRNGYLPFILSLFGSMLLALAIPQIGIRWTVVPGLGLLLTGSLLQSLSYSKFNKVKLYLCELQIRLLHRSSALSGITQNANTGTQDSHPENPS